MCLQPPSLTQTNLIVYSHTARPDQLRVNQNCPLRSIQTGPADSRGLSWFCPNQEAEPEKHSEAKSTLLETHTLAVWFYTNREIFNKLQSGFIFSHMRIKSQWRLAVWGKCCVGGVIGRLRKSRKNTPLQRLHGDSSGLIESLRHDHSPIRSVKPRHLDEIRAVICPVNVT